MSHPRAAVDAAALVAAYQAGATLAQVAARFGVSVGVVLRRLRDAGVPRRRQGWQPYPKEPRA